VFRVGFDSTALKKQIPSEGISSGEESSKPQVFKAFLGASVTTTNINFDLEYCQCLSKIFNKLGIPRRKMIYKGAHLLKQTKEHSESIIYNLLNELEPSISHVDLYCAFYSLPYISVFGQAQGQRLKPMTFIEKNQNSFDHVCLWWYWKTYGNIENDHEYCVDHFEGKSTPAWRELKDSKVGFDVYFSGGECNCLISLSDLILKLIQVFHFGTVDEISLVKPILRECSSYKRKARSHNLGRRGDIIKFTVPDIPLDMDVNLYLKHPIYFIAWTPHVPREKVKSSFEWSRFYNFIMKKTIETKGCVKFLDFDADMLIWNENDFIVPWRDVDKEHVELLKNMGFESMPKIIDIEELSKLKG